VLELFKGSELIYSKRIGEIAEGLYKYSGKQNLSIEELKYVDSSKDLEVLYLFKSINGFEDNKKINVESAEFYIFIKLP
jgi:hypothetical protein